MKLSFQLIFIFIAFTYIALVIALRFAPRGNLIDQLVRPVFIRHNITRQLFFLYRIGDARLSLALNHDPLTLTVWTNPGTGLNPQLNTWLTSMVGQTLARSAIVQTKSLPHAFSAPLTESDINGLIKFLKPSQSEVQLVYVPQAASAPTNAGQAINDRVMLIFTDTIQALSDGSHIRDMIEQSTLMHEWGHLLGLEHVDQADCIMNEKVEVYGNRRFQGSNLPTNYCPEELHQLKRLLE